MGRYVKRGYFHPIAFMAENPVSYAFWVIPISVFIAIPFRYQISSYWERQNQSPQAAIRAKAIMFYQELERMHRRQAVMNNSWQDDNPAMRTSISNLNNAIRAGVGEADEMYFRAHKRDVQRAQILLSEIRELKAKMADSAPTA
jgi:hypothetical protein